MTQGKRCAIGIPLDLMIELRKIKEKHHTTLVGALAIIINFYKKSKQNEN